ncbi:MAG: urease accessory protein UreD [Oscillospiraceae bacterium]
MSILKLTAENRNGRTVITYTEFTAPLKIANPFYRDGYTEVMMMAASAGILEGDAYDIEITVKKNANLKFTVQSYSKIFKADSRGASQRVKISVESGGRLVYMPSPVIPFGGSIFDARTEVRLQKDSSFVMTDILSCGRTAMKERFEFTSYRSRTAVYVEDKLCFLDNQRFVPSETTLSGIGFFEGCSHIGMMYVYGKEPTIPECERIEFALTKASRGTCIRAVADSADEIWQLFGKIIS